MKILMIVGSLRQGSYNRQLARQAAQLLEGHVQIQFLDYADLPMLNQDIEFPAPNSVARIRREIESSDGLWFFTPEYNGSIPGGLKNLLDWASRTYIPNDPNLVTALKGKKAAVSGVGGRAAAGRSREALVNVLKFIQVHVMETPQTGVALVGEDWSQADLVLKAEDAHTLQEQADAFLKFLQA